MFMKVIVTPAPFTIQFLILLLVAPSEADAQASHIQAETSVKLGLVLVIVSCLVPPKKPSMVTLSAPFNFTTVVVELPLMVRLFAVGCISTVA